MASLFISYSSHDRAAVTRLCAWLAEVGFVSLFVDVDPAGGIAIGDKWEAQLYAQLRRADAVLFVGTTASVRSQWCFAEIAMARSLGKRIFPISLEDGGRHPLLDDTQAVDLAGDVEQGLQRLHRSLSSSELGPDRTFDWDPARSPFPGLASFAEGDAGVFFGRHDETDAVLAQLRSLHRRHTGRLLAVVGPSGSGKSSLVSAGVLPSLRRTEEAWLILRTLRPGERPLSQLARALADAFAAAGVARTPASIEEALGIDGAPLVGLIDELSRLQPGEPRSVLLFVDQAEELVTYGDAPQRSQFLALLHDATRGLGPLWVLMTIRLDSLGALLEAARFAFDEQLVVGPLDNSRLAEVIERPADRAGIDLAPGLVGRMVADVGGGDALPLLAHTLFELHQRARARRSAAITHSDYDDIGGVVGALRRSADKQYAQLTGSGLGDRVLPTLNRLVTLGPDGQLMRRRDEGHGIRSARAPGPSGVH